MSDPSAAPAPPAPADFALTRSNKILLGVLGGGYALIKLTFGLVRGGDAEALGYAMGSLFAGLLLLAGLPALIAWLAWRLGARSQRAGSITFNALIATMAFLMLAGGLVDLVKDLAGQARVAEIRALNEQSAAEMQRIFEQGGDPAAVAEKYDRKVKAAMNAWAESETGERREILRAVNQVTRELEAEKDRFNAARKRFEQDDILDLKSLKAKDDFAVQRTVTEAYIAAARRLAAEVESHDGRLAERLERFKQEERYARQTMTGFRRGLQQTRPAMLRYLGQTAKYGEAAQALLQVLEDGWGQWAWDTKAEDFVFEDQQVLDGFNAARERLLQEEQRLNQTASELVGAM